MQKSYNVGIYCRLSRDDGNSESQSISNQQDMLKKYVEEKGWNLADEYVDDGWSGTDFERPNFKRMIDDVRCGRINCIITKDLSRLGRNYTMTGYYQEEFFPAHNVRFIAIHDGTDTFNNDEDFSGFRHVMNEQYPKDVSKKVKQVKRAGCEKGWFMGSQAPYGYRKSPQDKHLLIIDEEAAPIVERIFTEVANCTNARAIAEKLNQEGILSPQAYYLQWNNKPIEKSEWGSATIHAMVERPVYIGHLEQCGRIKPNFKNPKRLVVPKEDRVFVKDTHEPLIDMDLWNEVQKMRKSRSYTRKPKNNDKPETIFTSRIKCADCGAIMSATSKNNTKTAYRCGTYNNKGKTACTAHSIREEVLEAIVLNDIKKYININKQQLVDGVLKMLQVENSVNNSHIK